MDQDDELINLYSKRILAHAAQITHTTPLESYMGSAQKRSPLCGSNIFVTLNIENDAVSAFYQDVKACALGQAAASIIGKNIIGSTYQQIVQGRDELFTMLTQNAPSPHPPFEELEILRAATSYKNRHASIMLCFEAIINAFDEAKSA